MNVGKEAQVAENSYVTDLSILWAWTCSFLLEKRGIRAGWRGLSTQKKEETE
jgi:hypothetical protein